MLELDDRPPTDPFDDAPPDDPLPIDDPFSGPEPDYEAVPAQPGGRVVPFPANFGPAFEPPDAAAPPYLEPTLDELPAIVAGSPERALELRRETLIDRARAMQVVDDASYTAACAYMLTLKGWLNDADAHFNPRVAAAHGVWKTACDDRSNFKTPLQTVLDGLSARAGLWQRADADRKVREAQARQAKLDADAAAEKARLKAEADKAAKSGDSDRAQDLFVEASRVQAPVVKAEPAAKVKGVASKEKWTADVVDPVKLVHAVSGIDQVQEALKFRIDALSEGNPPVGYELAIGELRSLQVFIMQLKPHLPVGDLASPGAVIPNTVYLGGRARTDRGTITEEFERYGVRIYDAGTTALSPSRAGK